MKFDITPGDVNSTRKRAAGQGEDLDADIKMLLDGLNQATEGCGDGPVFAALQGISGYVRHTVRRPINQRLASVIMGAGEAADAYEDADRTMADDANRAGRIAENPLLFLPRKEG